MAMQRTPEQIQREIDQARASLAAAVDQIAQRTSPKALADRGKQTVRAKLATPQGKAVVGGAAAVVALYVAWRIRKRK